MDKNLIGNSLQMQNLAETRKKEKFQSIQIVIEFSNKWDFIH